MTSYVTRRRDKRRREEMIDEAVRWARQRYPVFWDFAVHGTAADAVQDAFAMLVRAEFRRLASQ